MESLIESVEIEKDAEKSVTCKLGPTPFTISPISLYIGGILVETDDSPEVVSGTVSPGKNLSTEWPLVNDHRSAKISYKT